MSATRTPTNKGKKGKIKTVDETYDVIEHDLKPYKPRPADVHYTPKKIVQTRMGKKVDKYNLQKNK